MPTAKDAHALVSHYLKEYKSVYGFEPTVNRHQARWGFDSVLMDLPYGEIKELLSYYFTTDAVHSLNNFLNTYDKIIKVRAEAAVDKEYRAQLAKESNDRAQKWRQSLADKGITGHKLGS